MILPKTEAPIPDRDTAISLRELQSMLSSPSPAGARLMKRRFRQIIILLESLPDFSAKPECGSTSQADYLLLPYDQLMKARPTFQCVSDHTSETLRVDSHHGNTFPAYFTGSPTRQDHRMLEMLSVIGGYFFRGTSVHLPSRCTQIFRSDAAVSRRGVVFTKRLRFPWSSVRPWPPRSAASCRRPPTSPKEHATGSAAAEIFPDHRVHSDVCIDRKRITVHQK